MIVSVGICDDEAIMRMQLATMLARYGDEHGVQIAVKQYCSGEELVAHLDDKTQVLFLDIGLAGITGIEAARKLADQRPDILIVFVTSMAQYALEGYSVHAFGFLMKPVRYQDVSNILDEALDKLNAAGNKRLVVRCDGRSAVIEVQDIRYVESFAHKMKIVLPDGNLQAGASMSWFEGKLANCGFYRVHRCYLANMRHITEIRDGRIWLDNGDDIPLSKQRSQDFMATFGDFIASWV